MIVLIQMPSQHNCCYANTIYDNKKMWYADSRIEKTSDSCTTRWANPCAFSAKYQLQNA